MVYYPIRTLVNAGVEDVMVVVGGNSAGDFVPLLANGREFGLTHLSYAYQEQEGGIAEALGLPAVEDFADGGSVMVVLGDNVLGENGTFRSIRDRFQHGAVVFLKEVLDPEMFGVPRFGEGGEIVAFEEKPECPPSDYAVIGVYMYDSDVFGVIRGLERSARGELEITDVNNAYLDRGEMSHFVLEEWWIDAGSSPDKLMEASSLASGRGPLS